MKICAGPDCGKEILLPPSAGGRRRFCSDRCRARAARKRASVLTEKKCGSCKVVKPIADFHAAYRGYCKDCHRTKQRDAYSSGKSYRGRDNSYEASLQRLYGITVDDYRALVAAQDGRCSICREVPDDRLHVDHDHATRAVRELLCGRCNAAIGSAREDPDLLRAMIAYLERHGR